MKKIILILTLILFPVSAGAVCLYDSNQMTTEEITAAKFACTAQNIEQPCTNQEAITFFQGEIQANLIDTYVDRYRESQATQADIKERFKQATTAQKCSALQALGYTQSEAETILELSAGGCA